METLYDALVEAALGHGNHAFLCVPARVDQPYHPGGVEITFAEMLSGVDALAARYQAAGWGIGHRVALALDNHPDHFLHFLALNKIGVSQVPVNPYYLPDELMYLYEHSEAALTIAAPWQAARLAAVGQQAIIWSEASKPDDFNPPAPSAPARPATPDLQTEIAVVYTSGTTARPKGCLLDNAYALTVGAWYRDLGGALHLRHGQERVYVPLPTFHVNGGINTPAAMLLSANCLILPDRFHATTWWDDLAATKTTAVHYLGIIPPALMNAPASPKDQSHKIRFGLGAGLDPSVHAAFEARFKIPMVEVWGMTETGRFLAANFEPRQIDTRAFGRPSGDLEAMVQGHDGCQVDRGEEGELCVRASGPDPRAGFFSGYLKEPEATQEAWRNGWFHTGDIVTQNESGMLYFVERAKNIIRRSGENISAAEVENALIDHPMIREVAVLACLDELRDEEVFACVTLTAPQSADIAYDLLKFAAQRIANHKIPGWLAIMDSLPITGTQKIQKHMIFGKENDPRDHANAIDLRSHKAKLRKSNG